MLTGGETGGECMSEVHGAVPGSIVIAAAETDGSAYTTTDASGFEAASDELLIAGRWSGTVAVWQQE